MEPNAPLKSFSPLIEDGKPEENFDITVSNIKKISNVCIYESVMYIYTV
jgi:hypothetical protein